LTVSLPDNFNKGLGFISPFLLSCWVFHLRASEGWLPREDLGDRDNVGVNQDSSHQLFPLGLTQIYHSLRTVSSFLFAKPAYAESVSCALTPVLWDRIVSIEFVGYEQVYDIEVEGTHNFIGNGIFAHNTAIPGSLDATAARSEAREGRQVTIGEIRGVKEAEGVVREYVSVGDRSNKISPKPPEAPSRTSVGIQPSQPEASFVSDAGQNATANPNINMTATTSTSLINQGAVLHGYMVSTPRG